MFFLLTSNKSGNIVSHYNYLSLGRSGYDYYLLKEKDLLNFSENILLFYLKDRFIVTQKTKNKKNYPIKRSFSAVGGSDSFSQPLPSNRVSILNKSSFPVAAILPPGYLRIYFPAYKIKKKANFLPFFAYTAIASSKDNEIYVAAFKIEDNLRWNPSQYNTVDLKTRINVYQKKYPHNRLLKHLAGCALNYNCYTAQNIFYRRWEGGIPTTSTCNAKCIGCISFQDKLMSPQKRIRFTPTILEISEIGINHLQNSESIISFGQGCEGEPLLKADLITKAIRQIRNKTNRGIININTNGSLSHAVKKLACARVDSFRISLNSTIDSHYKKYFKPLNYSLRNVAESIKIAKFYGCFVSLNLLVLPGVTDGKKETESLINFIKNNKVDMLQLRNLNIDPDLYYQKINLPVKDKWGIKKWYQIIKQSLPKEVKIGAFTPSKIVIK